MDFRQLLNKMDVLSEGQTLTLATLIASIQGWSQDDSVRYPIVAKLARDNGFAGLIDPTKGKYIPADWAEMGDEEDSPPLEEVKKLSAAGLIPQGAQLAKAGWFDDDDVYDAANKYWAGQSQQTADKHNQITSLTAKKIELQKQITDIIHKLQADGYEIPPEILRELDLMNKQIQPTPAQPPAPGLGSDSMNNYAKTAISPTMPSLSEAIIRSMNEDWKDTVSDYTQAAGRNFWNGATYGAGPEIYGTAKSYANDTKAKDEIQNQRNLLAQSQKEHPYLSTAANLLGGIASPVSKVGLGKSLLAAAGIGGAAYGADKALGVTDPDEQTTPNEQEELSNSIVNMQQSMGVEPTGDITPETVEAWKIYLKKYGVQ